MAEEPRHLVVGRLRKPHGLKGDYTVFPLTDDPASVFAPGREVWTLDLAGRVLEGPLTVERSRSYHREWLVKFAGVDGREALDPLRGSFLGAPREALVPPATGEVYVHELAGFAVRLEDETPIGLVTRCYDTPAGLMLEVQGPKREFLLPYRKEFVVHVDRAGRRLTVAPPNGLLDL